MVLFCFHFHPPKKARCLEPPPYTVALGSSRRTTVPYPRMAAARCCTPGHWRRRWSGSEWAPLSVLGWVKRVALVWGPTRSMNQVLVFLKLVSTRKQGVTGKREGGNSKAKQVFFNVEELCFNHEGPYLKGNNNTQWKHQHSRGLEGESPVVKDKNLRPPISEASGSGHVRSTWIWWRTLDLTPWVPLMFKDLKFLLFFFKKGSTFATMKNFN